MWARNSGTNGHGGGGSEVHLPGITVHIFHARKMFAMKVHRLSWSSAASGAVVPKLSGVKEDAMTALAHCAGVVPRPTRRMEMDGC